MVLYPALLAVLLTGAGLLVDRAAGSFLPAALLLCVGAAALIGLSQLAVLSSSLAPATPWLLAAASLAGYALGRERLGPLVAAARSAPWVLALPVLAYVLAISPVLLAGRATFSGYMAISDPAVHMIGADYLIRHGMDFSHLDLRSSYGQVINDYYNNNYPSGADTLFGASAKLIGLPLIWAFQPLNAFMLATCTGPAWLLCRRMGLGGALAAAGALAATLPALVFGYVIVSSVKEVTALSMILTLAVLAVEHEAWAGAGARRALPFGLVFAAGVSSLGVAFGVWGLAAVIVLAAALLPRLRGAALRATVALAAAAGAVLVVFAWPTLRHISGSIQVAQGIASTANGGNLVGRLRPELVLGTWLSGDYQRLPTGAALPLTQALLVLTLAAVVLGAVHLVRIRAAGLLGWFALMLLAWLAVSRLVTTWADAKTLMLTSPAVMLLAFGGVAMLRGRGIAPLAGVLAALLLGGVLASDAMQYHATDLAPTARYEELGSIGARYAGQGPVLVSDFDEFSLYQLRDMVPSGPSFRYPPPGLGLAAKDHGHPVRLDRAPPAALAAYPLLVTRRDPLAARPPSAYGLIWQGEFYDVWRRAAGALPAAAVLSSSRSAAIGCPSIGLLARRGGTLVASRAVPAVQAALLPATMPRTWRDLGSRIVMSGPGSIRGSFELPRAGEWELWLHGQFMPPTRLTVDGRTVASFSGAVDGDVIVHDTVGPFRAALAAGRHSLVLTRLPAPLAPGGAGTAEVSSVFLTSTASGGWPTIETVPAALWRRLCGPGLQWVELSGS